MKTCKKSHKAPHALQIRDLQTSRIDSTLKKILMTFAMPSKRYNFRPAPIGTGRFCIILKKREAEPDFSFAFHSKNPQRSEHFISVLDRLIERFLIGILQTAAYGQTKCEPCDLNAQRL